MVTRNLSLTPSCSNLLGFKILYATVSFLFACFVSQDRIPLCSSGCPLNSQRSDCHCLPSAEIKCAPSCPTSQCASYGFTLVLCFCVSVSLSSLCLHTCHILLYLFIDAPSVENHASEAGAGKQRATESQRQASHGHVVLGHVCNSVAGFLPSVFSVRNFG